MNQTSPTPVVNGIKGFLKKYKGQFCVGLLFLYVFLLGLGTIGEIWEIEWILDFPLFRPPGKY
jgi:hypothetical protein